LLKALPEIRRSGLDPRVTVHGSVIAEDDFTEEYIAGWLKRLAYRAGPAGSVIFAGTAGSAEKWDALHAADIFVLPTQYPIEGQPIALIEAMICGCPIVATRFRCIPSIVEHGVNGLLVDNADSSSVASAVIKLAKDPSLARQMSYRNVVSARRQFSWEATLAGLRSAILNHET
jgi:glycosyltransferase involved in cell wall biosynthesis